MRFNKLKNFVDQSRMLIKMSSFAQVLRDTFLLRVLLDENINYRFMAFSLSGGERERERPPEHFYQKL